MSKRNVMKFVAPLLLVAISALVSPSGHAAARRYTVWKKSLRYEAAFNIPVVGLNAHFSQTDPTCGSSGKTCRLATDGETDIGGMSFDPIGGSGKVNVTITVKDDNNLYGRVPISACQDLNGNLVCDPGEPRVSRCLSPKQSMVLAAARNKPITIFVSAFDGCPDITNVGNSQGGATRGLVTLTALLPR